jgi:hypothetical protein
VVVGLPAGVKLGDHDVQQLPDEQQHGRQAQRRAIDHGNSAFAPLVRGDLVDGHGWNPFFSATGSR